MPYVKDNLGNSVWVAGDDTSQQQEKMAGIERHNIFRSPASVVGGSVQDVKPASSKPGTVSQPVTPTQPVQQTAVTKSQGTVTGGIQNRTSITSTEELARAMGYTSPEEENRLRRASVANQRLLALTDALRHIGNIHNTVNGAPSQTFNSPVEAEVARYKQDKAIRDAANARYLSYQQQKAAQEQKARQWEAEQKYKRDKDNRDFLWNANKWANEFGEKKRQYDQNYGLNVEKHKANVARQERVDAETKRSHLVNEGYRGRSVAIAAANHALSRQRFEWDKQNGGGKNSSPIRLRGTKGFYSRTMGADERNSFYNQAYEEMSRRGYIDSSKTYGSEAAMKRAVDDALLQHPEVGDWLVNEYEFEFDPRQTNTFVESQPAQPSNFGYTPTWRGGGSKSLGIGIGSQPSSNSGMKLGLGL